MGQQKLASGVDGSELTRSHNRVPQIPAPSPTPEILFGIIVRFHLPRPFAGELPLAIISREDRGRRDMCSSINTPSGV